MQATAISKMRIFTGISASVGTLLTLSAVYADIYYQGSFQAGALFWLLVTACATLWVAFLAAGIRDQLMAREERFFGAIVDLHLEIHEYGDKRDIRGRLSAARSPEIHNSRRSLSSVD